MALDSIQNKYLEGVGSPEGIIKGKKGFTYKDTLTNDEYTSLGGNKWRKEVTNNNNLISRTFSSIDELTEINDLSENEIVNLNYKINDKENLNVSYKTVYNYSKKYITYIADASTIARNRWSTSSIVDFNEGDTLSITCRIGENQINIIGEPYRYMRLFAVSGIFDIAIREREDNTLSFYGSNFIVTNIENEIGEVKSIDQRYNEWLTITFKITTSAIGSPLLFASTINGTGIDILEFRIKDEVFTFKDDPDEFTWQSDTKTMEFTPRSIADRPIITEKNYLDTPYPGIIKTQKGIVKAIITDGTITPQTLGYNTLLNKNFEVNNDAAQILQMCFDSPYIVKIPPGNYYISKGLEITKPKNIYMYGTDVNVMKYKTFLDYDLESVDYYSNQNDSTIIYSDQNIDYITIKHSNVNIEKGIIFTGLSINHDKSAYVYDLRNKMWGGNLKDIGVLGSWLNITERKKGTTGIYINVDEAAGGVTGSLTMINISGTIHTCKTGVLIPEKEEGDGTWLNSINFDIHMKACRKFYDMKVGSLFTINGVLQDATLLEKDTKERYEHAVDLNINNSLINVFVFDRSKQSSYLGIEYFAHSLANIRIKGEGNTIIDKSFRGADFSNNGDLNTKQIIRNPSGTFLHTSARSAVISGLQNQIKFMGVVSPIMMKSFLIPNGIDNWLQTNLFSADDVRNIQPLTENLAVASISKKTVLNNRGNTELNTFYIHDPKGFIEINIPFFTKDSVLDFIVTIKRISSIRGLRLENIQVIFRDETIGEENEIAFFKENPVIIDGSYSFPENRNRKAKVSYNGIRTHYRGDIYTEELETENGTVVNESWIVKNKGEDTNGDVVNTGDLMVWDGVEWVNQGTPTVTPFYNLKWTHVTIRLVGNIGGTDNIRLEDICLITATESNNPVLDLIGDQTVLGGMKMLGEFEPESIKGTTPIDTTNTETTIQLVTTGGNFCNMGSASTIKTFTTTGNVLGAWAEVLINRIDQPSITGATYKSSKGVPFVASTDMIMRVENKGVPRGVWYWFEEI